MPVEEAVLKPYWVSVPIPMQLQQWSYFGVWMEYMEAFMLLLAICYAVAWLILHSFYLLPCTDTLSCTSEPSSRLCSASCVLGQKFMAVFVYVEQIILLLHVMLLNGRLPEASCYSSKMDGFEEQLIWFCWVGEHVTLVHDIFPSLWLTREIPDLFSLTTPHPKTRASLPTSHTLSHGGKSKNLCLILLSLLFLCLAMHVTCAAEGGILIICPPHVFLDYKRSIRQGRSKLHNDRSVVSHL